MIAAGHRMVADGWALFEEAIEGAGEGDLQQLLHHLRGVTTPTPPPQQSATPTDVPPTPSPAKKIKTKNLGDQPVIVMVGGESLMGLPPQCNMVRGSKKGCDTHIWQVHRGKALVCDLCSFPHTIWIHCRGTKRNTTDWFYFNFRFENTVNKEKYDWIYIVLVLFDVRQVKQTNVSQVNEYKQSVIAYVKHVGRNV